MGRHRGSEPIRQGDKWRIRWTGEFGQRRSETWPDYNTALLKLREHELEVERIVQGYRGVVDTSRTFNNVFDYWIEKRAPLKRSCDDDLSIIRAHLRPAFGKLRLCDLTLAHIDAFVEARAHLNVKTLNNQLTLLITVLNVAKEHHWITDFPRIRKPKSKGEVEDCRFLRTKEDVARFLRAAQDEGEHVYTFYATALYTGMRAGELAGLRWDDVDFEHRLITVQRSFDGPTKSGRVRRVPILDVLLPLLQRWRLRCPTESVFTNRHGGTYGESARVFQEVLHRVLTRAGFLTTEKNGRTRWYIRFHDLRHSFASHWMMNGGDIFKLQKILGHSSVLVTMRYAHLAPNAFASDYSRFGSEAPHQGEAPVTAIRMG